MSNKKVRNITTVAIVAGCVVIALGSLSYYEKQKLTASNIEKTNYMNELTENTKTVYVAKSAIKKGDKILTDEMAEKLNAKNDASQSPDDETAGAIISNAAVGNVYQEQIYSSSSSDLYISDDDLGSVAITPIEAEQPVEKNMVKALSITEDTREFEITAVNLMVNQEDGDTVDVRISYPNGEDYLVLAKKQIETLSLKNSVFHTYMNEDEILRYKSAVTDAYQTTGAILYTVKYADDNLQSDAIPNYLVRSATIDLIKSDPNVYSKAEQTMNASARLSLETRLGQLTDDQLAAMSDGYGIADTARGSVLQENVDNNADTIDSLGIDDASADASTDSSSDSASESSSTNTSSDASSSSSN